MTGNDYRAKRIGATLGLLILAMPLYAQVPSSINYQGRVVVQGTNYDGVGQFKFELINSAGTVTHWSNDGTGAGGTEPTSAVSVSISKGLFFVRLGDTNVANMASIPASVFTNADVRLRIWFSRGTGFEQLTPDQVIASVGYAMMSASVADGSVTPGKLATNVYPLFVGSAGGSMSGALTNTVGFVGNGAGLTNLSVGAYTETDPTWTAASNLYYLKTQANALFATGMPVYVESDPSYIASVAAGITGVQTGQWNTAYGWGSHAAAGYAVAASNLADLASASAARNNLGLGSLAVQDAAAVAVGGGTLTNVSVAVASNQFTVGNGQLVVANDRVGIGVGTTVPDSKFEVVGGTGSGEYVLKIYSGTNLIAWGRKK